MDLILAYAREFALVAAAGLTVWLFLKAEACRPIVLLFAPVLLWTVATVKHFDVATLHAAADHVQAVMFQAVGVF